MAIVNAVGTWGRSKRAIKVRVVPVWGISHAVSLGQRKFTTQSVIEVHYTNGKVQRWVMTIEEFDEMFGD